MALGNSWRMGGFAFIIIGGIFGLVGAFVPSDKEINTNLPHNKNPQAFYVQDRRCPACGRPIPMDASLCPFCCKDFRNIS